MKKNKEKFYKQKLRSGLVIAILFLIIAIAFTLIVSNMFNSKSEFKKTAQKTTATIIEIKYKGANISDEGEVSNIEYVLVEYVVDGNKYEGRLKDISTNMYEGKEISIYYNSLNPNDFIQYTFIEDIGLRAFGYFMTCLGIVVVIKHIRKVAIYISTLNGKEVDASNIEVIEKNMLGSKHYVLKCDWTDEKGIKHVFLSENFFEPCLDKTLKELNITSLKVRFNIENPKKYVVLTEKLDKELSV